MLSNQVWRVPFICLKGGWFISTKRPNTSIEFSQREEGVVAQAGQYPPFNDLNTYLGFRFIRWFLRQSRDNGYAGVSGELLIGWIGFWVITTRFGHPTFKVFGYHYFRHTTNKFKGANMDT